VKTYKHIAERLWEASIVGLRWEPCAREAELVFRDGEARFHVILRGIHCFCTRQSLLGSHDYIPISEENWEDWSVHYFEVFEKSPFLDSFLKKHLGFTTDVVVYDSQGNRAAETSGSRVPVHVAVGAGGGNLDVVCETMEFDGER